MNDNNNLADCILQGIPVKVEEKERLVIVTPSMTAKEYAAIRLKVPRSGDTEIDGMIRESVRRDFVEKALAGLLAGSNLKDETSEGYATRAYGLAKAMLAKWEKEAAHDF